jgi:hypothetical protein
MVDALRRAHRMLCVNGRVVDVHPTETAAAVQVGERTIGHVDGRDARLRHAAAGAALSTVIEEGLFVVTATVEFDFYTYGDSIDELRDYIGDTWKDARINDETVVRAHDVLVAATAGIRPRVREHVRLTTLRPVAVTSYEF